MKIILLSFLNKPVTNKMQQGEDSQSSQSGQALTTTFAAFQSPALHTVRYKCYSQLYWAHFFIKYHML